MTGPEAVVERAADLFGRCFVVALLFVVAAVVVLGGLVLANGWRARP